jgi:acyl-homoserine lactone acylase PvdQ
MSKYVLSFLLLSHLLFSQSAADLARWKTQASHVEIVRDTYGVPHIYGKSDADAVFGLLYAQCEDDFSRVEMNYIEKLGRMSEVKGESQVANDLYIRLIIDAEEAKADYAKSPAWLKTLLQAYADGINYYLYKNPKVKPALLTHFEPWFPLLWTDGSIGAISTGDVQAEEAAKFYQIRSSVAFTQVKAHGPDEKLTGSNGFAVGPTLSKSGHSLLYINPHVTFYFRPEVHMNSEAGMNVYGAVTWGQFFIYQGFNPYGGWMHTSSEVDVADLYAETTRVHGTGYQYQVDGRWLDIKEKQISLRVKGESNPRTVKAFYTHRGAVMASRDGRWISVRSFNRSLKSLEQSWLRTKTKGLADYTKVMEMRANTSNNTVYADNQGNIAYWHGNYVPRRDPAVDWGLVQDGSKSSNDWKGLHALNEIVSVVNPETAWIQNCNSTPFTVSGTSSPKRANFPVYMAPDGENFRDKNAVRLFSEAQRMDLNELIKLGYDRNLGAFQVLLPALVRDFDAQPVEALRPLVDSLRHWDYHVSNLSVAQTLAVRWGLKILPKIPKPLTFGGQSDPVQNFMNYAASHPATETVEALQAVYADLIRDFGRWNVSWGDMNRFQRLSNTAIFDDAKPSIPVPFTSSAWGQLPSYTSRPYQGSKKWYGVNGNSFVCAVEFGSKVKAYSLLAGGQQGDPTSPHFFDQSQDYADGKFKEVLFYKADVLKHVEKRYKLN